jgi:hypothetical protein
MKICINCHHPDLCHETINDKTVCYRISGDLHKCECALYKEAPMQSPMIGPSVDDLNAIMKLAIGQAKGDWDNRLTD